MNVGAIIALLKLAQDSGLTPKAERPKQKDLLFLDGIKKFVILIS